MSLSRIVEVKRRLEYEPETRNKTGISRVIESGLHLLYEQFTSTAFHDRGFQAGTVRS